VVRNFSYTTGSHVMRKWFLEMMDGEKSLTVTIGIIFVLLVIGLVMVG
jgi:hypothetical protein